MTYRLRNIVIAVVLAGLAAALTLIYVNDVKRGAKKNIELVSVLVAARDIPVGTPGSDILNGHLLAHRQVTREAVVPGAITSPQQIAGLVATQPVYAGDQLTARRFGPVAASGVRSKLTGTYRAVQVTGDVHQLLAGTLRVGDHVDLLANVKYPDESSSKHFTRVILRDILVLKLSGQSSGPTKIASGPNGQEWVMVRVTDAQSEKLFFTTANEEWSLALRPTLNSADSPNNLEDAPTLLADGAKGAAERLKAYLDSQVTR